MLDQQELWQATKAKQRALFNHVKDMRMREKRSVFFILRSSDDLNVDTFMPAYGLHCGEFCVFKILGEHQRREERRCGNNAAAVEQEY